MSLVRLKPSQIALVRARILERRQEFTCAVCPQPITVATSCLDHDHYSGLIRGVLCMNCNGIEGKIKNLAIRARRTLSSEDYLLRLIKYWDVYKTDQTGLLHPLHKSSDEKRLLKNKRAKKKRALRKVA